MTDQVQCVVVGAGVVGLAVARALALRGMDVMVLVFIRMERHLRVISQQHGQAPRQP